MNVSEVTGLEINSKKKPKRYTIEKNQKNLALKMTEKKHFQHVELPCVFKKKTNTPQLT